MKRDLSIEELRDEKIAELTDEYVEARRALLSSGDANMTRGVCEALSAALPVQIWEGMVQICQTEPEMAGTALAMIVGKVLRDAAETDALREVERMEKQRAQLVDEARAESVMCDRMAVDQQ